MKIRLAALATLLMAGSAAAQPIIIPLSKQQPQEQQPPASPVPVAPPQAAATPGAGSQPAPQPSNTGATAQGNSSPNDAGSGEGQPSAPAR